MTITRMQEPRQMYQQGGIMQVAPRQGYFLGKLVKSIGKGVKKIVKSPVGKGLLLAGGLGLAGIGPFSGLARTGVGQALFGGATKFLPGATAAMKGAATTSPGLFGMAKNFLGNLSTGAKLGIGTSLVSALAASGMGEQEIEAAKRDPDKLRIYLKDYFSKLNPNASETEIEEFVETNVSEYATGGRVGFKDGKNMMMASMDDDYEEEFMKRVQDLREQGFSQEEAIEAVRDELERLRSKFMATGGRVGFKDGKNMMMASAPDPADSLNDLSQMLFGKNLDELTDEEYDALQEKARDTLAVGGRVGLEKGTPEKGLESISIKDLPLIKGPYMIKYDKDGNPVKFPKPKGEPYRYDPEKEIPKRLLLRNKSAMGGMPTGIMRTNQAGTIERDYRETGGFVPVGIKEKADDVPAMLSKNEFVMTADAVRGAGGGSIEKGAQKLYDQMKSLENKVV